MSRLLVGLLAILTAACTAMPNGTAAEPDSSPTAGPVTASPTMQPEDVVDLTVYYRSGEGEGAYLVPVTKETSVDDDLPRTALELLLAGPGEDDGRDLAAPLPTATEVRSLRVEQGTAHVDLSREVITEAESANPEHEALALAALVGTLSELPAITQVRLSVEGESTGVHDGVDVGAFWGGWGLPEVLVPDDSVMSEPVEGEGVPDLTLFGDEPQEVGSSTDDAIAVPSVRIRDRTTYLRVVVELEHADDDDADASPGVPPARARIEGNKLVLEVDDIAHYDADFAPGQRLELDDPPFDGVSVEETERDGLVRIVVMPAGDRDFWLHTLSSPTRIVLDVRK